MEKTVIDREPFEDNLRFVVERIGRFVHLSVADELTLMAATWHRFVDRVSGNTKWIERGTVLADS